MLKLPRFIFLKILAREIVKALPTSSVPIQRRQTLLSTIWMENLFKVGCYMSCPQMRKNRAG